MLSYRRVLLVAAIFHSSLVQSQEKSKISPNLLTLLKNHESTNVLVSFTNGIDHVIKSSSSISHQDANTKAQSLFEALLANSEKSQKSVVKLLTAKQDNNLEVDFKKFWITNEIVVDDAGLKLVEKISQDDSVSSIIEEPEEQLVPDYSKWQAYTNLAGKPPPTLLQWNIEKTQAPQAWELLNGRRGNGTIIGIFDSGVKLTHEALSHNYLGEYGWFDPYGKSKLPFDDLKHGTPCAGIAVGSKFIGVAPDAKWSACKGCVLGKCKRQFMLACGQFFACPTQHDGKKPDCSKRPHIISNSWFATEGSDYTDMVKVWREMGIIPVFAMGNGNKCCPVKHPANLNTVIAVGDTMKNDDLASDTCTGVASNGSNTIKPDVVAPGYEITSANSADNKSYVGLSGTTMACPHVAGVIALILSNNLKMGFEEVRNILISNTDKKATGSECSNEKPLNYPNAYYGHGCVNAYKSVNTIEI